MTDDGRERSLVPGLARAGAVLGAVALLHAVRPGVVENGLRSPRVWLVVVAVLVAGRLVAAAVRRLTPWPAAGAVAGGLLVVAAGAALLAPSFQQRTVSEPFPEAELAAAPAGTASARPVAPAVTAGPGPATRPAVATGAGTVTAPAVAAGAGTVTAPAAGTLTTAPAAAGPTPAAPTSAGPTSARSPSAPPAASARTVVARGTLEGVGHAASGRVVLYRLGDRLALRFDDVDIEGTPGPVVHLVPAGQQDPGGGTALGPLTAERGSFSYALPAVVDLPRTVLVWCRPYRTPVATARLVSA